MKANAADAFAVPADDPYSFVPTEYVSHGGCGHCMLKLYADGWHVRVWRGQGRGYVNIGTGPCATIREAVEAYKAWNAEALAGKSQG